MDLQTVNGFNLKKDSQNKIHQTTSNKAHHLCGKIPNIVYLEIASQCYQQYTTIICPLCIRSG